MYDFGDFDSNGVMGNPYMKLLSMVDPDQASIEFHRVRGGTPKTNITFTGLDGASIAPSFAISNDITQSLELIGKFIPAMLGIVALNALVVIICCAVWLVSFCRERRRKNATIRTPRRRLSPMPMNPRNSYIAGMDPSAINAHTYEPVSMALTDDTFVPPSPAFHRFNKKGDGFGARPHSLSSAKAYEPVSPGPDDSFSPVYTTEHRMSTVDNNANDDRGSTRGYHADARSVRNEGVSLRDEGVSIRDDRSVRDERPSPRDERFSLRDERVSLRNERISLRDERVSPRPSMEPDVSPIGDTSFVRSSVHSQLYERSSPPAPIATIPHIQEPIAARAEAFAPAVGLAVPHSQHILSHTNGGNLSPTSQAFYRPNIGPGQRAVPPPIPGYLLPHHRSSQVYQTNNTGADMGDRPRSIA
jgi:hypothetical protein